MRKPVHHLAEFKGTKIRVLASPFQLEMIKRMGASPMAMSLGTCCRRSSKAPLMARWARWRSTVTMHYRDVSKYIVQTGQPWVNDIAVLSRKWLDSLPDDLQKVVRSDALTVSRDIVPFVNDFYAAQLRHGLPRAVNSLVLQQTNSPL